MSNLTPSALAGVAGAFAYLAEQELDRRWLNSRSDDLILLGGMLVSDDRYARLLGLAMHLTAGGLFGVAFGRAMAPRLVGPYWLRGVVAAQIENAALWPLVIFLDRVHPAVRRGSLAPLSRPVYFGQAVLRHLALGATVGLLEGRSRLAARWGRAWA